VALDLDTSITSVEVNGDAPNGDATKGAAPAALVALARVGLVVSLSEVPGALGQDESDASETLASLLAGGWVELWPEGGSVALSPLAASALGLRVPPPPAPKRPWRRSPERLATDVFRRENGDLDHLVDKRAPDPSKQVEQWERITWPGCDPYPLKFLGMNVNPWLPRHPRRRPCPGCAGRKLSPVEVCLVEDCLRCGSDRRIGRPRPEEMPRLTYTTDGGLAGGTGPIRRRRG
jgi:hypothetical protein